MLAIKKVVRKTKSGIKEYYYKQTKVATGALTKTGKPKYKTVRTAVATSDKGIGKQALEKFIKQNTLSLSEANRLIINAKDFAARGLTLTAQEVAWKTTNNRIASWIISSGNTPTELAIKLSTDFGVVIDEDYLLNADHWKRDAKGSLTSTLILPDGTEVVFDVEYDGTTVDVSYQ